MFPGREAGLYRFVNEQGRGRQIDTYVFGHWHRGARLPVESGGELVIVGAWTKAEDTFYL